MATRTLAVGVACAATLTLTAPSSLEQAEAASRQRRQLPTITIDARSSKGPVRPGLLGVNHRYVNDGHGLWNAESDAPDPVAVRRLRSAGVSLVRYPGGIVANLFDWKESVGEVEQRRCQTNGHWRAAGYRAVKGLAYGPDEHMRFVKAGGAKAVMVVPIATETPADAADWVEYMNSPDDGPGERNPHGGTDWAHERALNGRKAPYRVGLWEVGNEQRVGNQRYWMSSNGNRALRQYTNGGSRFITDERLGRNCRHPNVGVPSNGNAGQVFEMVFPPVAPGSETVTVEGETWQRVDDLQDRGPLAQVFEFDASEGQVRFGDGTHGAIPPSGALVKASYRSTHKGVFSFIRKMKEVDPRIKVCPTWGLKEFVRVAGRRRYDCFSAHAYTHFAAEGHRRWRSPTQGHDRHMLGTRSEQQFIAELKRSLPRGVPIALTEFGAIWGNSEVFPHWSASMTHAVYMATMWVHWLDLGIPWAIGSDLLARSYRGMLGPTPDFTYSAEALTREAILPVFDAGGRRVRVDVARNPVRNTRLRAGDYSALSVAATRGRNRSLYVLVVNRLPGKASRVRVRMRLDGFRSRRVAFSRRVNGPSFRSWNRAGQQQVRLRRDRTRIGRNRFTYVFPPHSVTVLRIPSR